jgi:uroporphyrinogen-III synthase
MAIQNAHGRPIGFPALEILGPRDKEQVRARLSAVAGADLLIFVSRNAVRYAFPFMPGTLPLDLQIAAVGSATGQALADAGLEPTLVPRRMDSEGLLELPALQDMQGRRVMIVRGDGGRELLKESLEERGARVEYIEVYRRRCPQRRPDNLIRGWHKMVDAVTVTSGDILDNLFRMLGEEGGALLRTTPLVVVSERLAAYAAHAGCQRIHVARSALDEDLLATLCEVQEDVT